MTVIDATFYNSTTKDPSPSSVRHYTPKNLKGMLRRAFIFTRPSQQQTDTGFVASGNLYERVTKNVTET